MRTLIICFCLCSITTCSFSQKKVPECRFKFDHFTSVAIPEPSDIVYDSASRHFYMVSDHGALFECDLAGNVLSKALQEGLDFEGVEVKDSFIYVSDETPRKVYKYKKRNLAFVRTYEVSWQGAMNKAFESIAYNYTKGCFILASQQPPVVVEYDNDFKEINKYPFHSSRDLSAARWYKGNIYLLSNKDAAIFKCDPNTYQVLEKYNINVLNPEGLAFDANGNVAITSDALQRLYFFKNLPTIK